MHPTPCLSLIHAMNNSRMILDCSPSNVYTEHNILPNWVQALGFYSLLLNVYQLKTYYLIRNRE